MTTKAKIITIQECNRHIQEIFECQYCQRTKGLKVIPLEDHEKIVEELCLTWRIPLDQFWYIGKCNVCERPCLEIQQETTGLCSSCETSVDRYKQSLRQQVEKMEVEYIEETEEGNDPQTATEKEWIRKEDVLKLLGKAEMSENIV